MDFPVPATLRANVADDAGAGIHDRREDGRRSGFIWKGNLQEGRIVRENHARPDAARTVSYDSRRSFL